MQFIDVTSSTKLKSILPSLPKELALDVETTDKNPRVAKLLCFVLANADVAYKIPAEFMPLVYPHLLRCRVLYLQNFKYDYQVLFRHGYDLIEVPFIDTMLLHHLIDENKAHDLDSLVKEYYADDYKTPFWIKYKSFEESTAQDSLEYVCKDGIYTYRLAKYFLRELSDRSGLVEHVHRLATALYQTEILGVHVDLSLMQRTQSDMQKDIDAYLPTLRREFLAHCESWELEQWCKKLNSLKTERGRQNTKRPTFNFGSDPQVSWLLYQSLKLPVLKRTKKGNPSTDYETVESLEKQEPRLATLKAYKAIKNLYATFVVGLLERVEDGKIYPSFSVNGTETGRISHSNPNMGNMPSDGVFRNFFVPSPGRVLIGADYEQLEINVAANLSGDKMLRKVLEEGLSVHDIAVEKLGLDRPTAKSFNFAIQYGAQEFKISKIVGCSVPEAKKLIDGHWEIYPNLKKLIDYCHQCVEDGTPIENRFGRRRHFPTHFENKWELESAKRQAFNALIQGTGADLTHMGFYLMSERLEANGRGRMLWEVHDEELGEVDTYDCEEEKTALVEIMQSLGKKIDFEIPLKAKSYGPLTRWAKC